MAKILVSEAAIRELVKEVFDTPAFDVALVTSDESLPVVVNPMIGDGAGAIEISPVDVEFVPHDKTEFEVAIKQLSKGIHDEIIPSLFAKIRDVILDDQEKCNTHKTPGESEEMKKREDAKLGMEEALRRIIRQVIKEDLDGHDVDDEDVPNVKKNSTPTHLAGGRNNDSFDDDDFEVNPGRVWDPESWEDDDYDAETVNKHAVQVDREEFGLDPWDNDELDTGDVDAETSSEWDPEPVVTTPKKRENQGGTGVEGDQLGKLADKLGISASGAKRLLTTGVGKLQYMMDLSDDDVKDIVHGAARDWVEKLVDKGRLDDAEGRTWLRHLDIVAQNDEFREFLHDYIRDEMKKDDEWVYKEDPEAGGIMRRSDAIGKAKKNTKDVAGE